MAKSEIIIARGQYQVRLAQDAADIQAAQRLRTLCFGTIAPDQDVFDSKCLHLLVEEVSSLTLVSCCRLLIFSGGQEVGVSYSAQFYDLASLLAYPGAVAELGRFCVRPGLPDADVLRLAWGAITKLVDQNEVQLLFGCSSFSGTSSNDYLDAFLHLRERHLGPEQWRPQPKARDRVEFEDLPEVPIDAKKALSRMPPLLRSYLVMGGWVSDHAVIDRHMNTLHVFTGLEINRIPDNRKRLLRAVAGAA